MFTVGQKAFVKVPAVSSVEGTVWHTKVKIEIIGPSFPYGKKTLVPIKMHGILTLVEESELTDA